MEQSYSRSGAWREARALLWRHRRTLGAGLAFVVVNRAAALALPVSSRYLVDDVIGRQRGDLLLPVALLAGTAVAVESATGFAVSQVVGIGAQRAITELRRSLQARLLQLPVGFFDRTQTGSLVARVMSDAEQLRSMIGTGLIQLVSGALTAVFALGFLVTLNLRLTALIVVVLATFAVAASRGFGWLHAAFRGTSQINAEVTGRLAESLGGIRVVKAHAAERHEARAFARGAHRLLRAVARAHTGVSVLMASMTLATGLVSLLILVIGGRAVLGGAMSLGDLVMYVFLVGLLSAPLLQTAASAGELGKALAGLGRIRELRELESEAADDAARGARPVRGIAGAVAFEGVSYAYLPGRPVLQDIDFVALAGSTTALVGRSGSGKSTICQLLLAYDYPAAGRILVDGCDLTLLRRGEYRRYLGVVPQDGFLFDASVTENIRYARPQATMAEVRAAARAAHCDEFIDGLPQGYDTVVGERGGTLSGGQRQRVAIARAVLADPRILILDEATSSLDSESEVLIQDALAVLTRGRTTFVIAHRLSMVERADQILVLEAGRIVERGVHEKLLAAGLVYRRLYERQHPAAASSGDGAVDSLAARWPARPRANGHREAGVRGGS